MITKRNKADIVVILKTLPVIEAIKTLSAKVLDELIKFDALNETALAVEIIEGGFEVMNIENKACARVLIATIMSNIRRIDSNVHVSVRLLQRHMAAIRHMRWFDETANLTTIKVLIRVLRDVADRYDGLKALTPWMITVLSHYAVTFRKSQQLLPLHVAFKRVFQLLASGLFLPGSTGIPDPINLVTMHSQLSFSDLDKICLTAQTLLRVLSHTDGYKVILGLEKDSMEEVGGFTKNMSIWGGVVVVPSNEAYEGYKREDVARQPSVESDDAKGNADDAIGNGDNSNGNLEESTDAL